MNAQNIIDEIASTWSENWDVLTDFLGEELANKIDNQAFQLNKQELTQELNELADQLQARDMCNGVLETLLSCAEDEIEQGKLTEAKTSINTVKSKTLELLLEWQ